MRLRPERVLPKEMWVAILRYLTDGELCCMALVSKYYYSLVSCPHLWLKRAINKTKIRHAGVVPVFNIPRFQSIKHLDLSNSRLARSHCISLFTNLNWHPDIKVRSVNLQGVNLSSIPATLLATCVARLHGVNLLETMLTTTQVARLYSIMFRCVHLFNI